ncbi:hypothetical protein [Roseimaritima ulvae]|uniref:Uncharacterized protein n=1 Tax=Roseimaritima ulvae TaxID=980254 RepID=A0A5B9QR50_9BACT|nr:hypothetical protein [Roseimaritima ulvae]QEG40389.1 hypothetical protein UC8_23990 [Roseimaritima ulvae]
MSCLRWMLCGLTAALFAAATGFALPALAQPPAQGFGSATDDPFGGANRAQADPFGGTAGDANDPFNAPKQVQADPFAAPVGKPAAPFADPRPALADPFGAPSLKPADSPAPGKPVTTYTPSSGSRDVERQIERALQAKASVSFVESPLYECIELLAEEHQIPILIDERSLEEIGLSRDVPITLNVKNISLRSCLRLMLSNLDLTYILKDEVLQITTLENAEQNLSTVVYRLDSTGLKANDARQLITRSIHSDTWETLGGPSSIQAMSSEDEQHHLLIVSTTRKTHEQIAELLQRLATEKVSGLQLLPPAGQAASPQGSVPASQSPAANADKGGRGSSN